MKELSPVPGPSSSVACVSLLAEELDIKTEKEEIDQLELPQETDTVAEQAPPPEEDDRIPRIAFRCESCEMNEMVHYKGTEPPFVLGIKLHEESYVMRDPFQPHPPRYRRKPEFSIILGAHCCICEKVVCRDAECSFFYVSTFCLSCAERAVKSFPLEVQTKLRKQLVSAQK